MRSNIAHAAYPLLVVIVGIALGLVCLSTPRPYPGGNPGRFSAVNAANWLQVISKEPHSICDPDAHQRVLDYLVQELKSMGIQPTLAEYPIESPFSELPDYSIYNVHARLEGKSERAILLVAHYDSVCRWNRELRRPYAGESFGAADDGYGLVTILEVLRALKAQNRQLENTVQILFTDAEEAGIVGAGKEMELNLANYRNVELVINIEARGIKGPVILFETGPNNSASMDYYFQNAGLPFSYSLAPAVYRLMPNDTDFSRFLDQGFSGYNLAVVDNLDYYHTREDNFGNISLSSLQHYGEQILPVVEHFAFTPADELPEFESPSDEVFFNVLPGFIIHYPEHVAWYLHILVTVGWAVLMVVFIGRQQATVAGVLKLAALMFLLELLAASVGTLIVYLLALAFRKNFNIIYLPGIPYAGWVFAAMLLSCAAALWMVQKRWALRYTTAQVLLSGLLLTVVWGTVALLYLPGASYLLTVPALLFTGVILFWGFIRNRLVQHLWGAFAVGVTLVLYVPLLYLLYCALTLGASGALSAIGMMALVLVMPVLIDPGHRPALTEPTVR